MSTDTDLTITIPEGEAPLYCRYDRASTPQPAHLEIDPRDRTVTWGYNSDVDARTVPVSVYARLRLWIGCPASLSQGQLRALTDELRPLIARVIDGHSVEWDGNNSVGVLTDEAEAALAEIRRLLDETDGEAQVWLVADWLREDRSALRRRLQTESVETIAAEIVDAAHCDRVVLDGDVTDYLTALATDDA